MLHFPSSSTAAHRPAPREVNRLGQLLNDDVWAFSNCRVDAPGKPVSEVDWLFYNVRLGAFTVCEWKGYPKKVAAVTDTGSPWLLEDGSAVPNPIEQVARQLDAVRAVLRGRVRERFFPDIDPQALNAFQCVYSPQIAHDTKHERLRFGKVDGTLEGLVRTVLGRSSPVPLVVADEATRMQLAMTLAELFRCNVSAGVKRKLGFPPSTVQQAAVTQRMAEIHLQISALHQELAQLLMEGQRANPGTAPIPAAALTSPVIVTPRQKKPTVSPASGSARKTNKQQKLKAHLHTHLAIAGQKSDTAVPALRQAWISALTQTDLYQVEGISVAFFGSSVRPHLKDFTSFKDLLGSSLPKWCLQQAQEAGLRPVALPAANPAHIRVPNRTPVTALMVTTRT